MFADLQASIVMREGADFAVPKLKQSMCSSSPLLHPFTDPDSEGAQLRMGL